MRQSKSIGRHRRTVNVVIPVGAPLKMALDAAAKSKKSPIILSQFGWATLDRRWIPFVLQQGLRDKAGIGGVTFDDMRGTAVTRLALEGCTEAQIVSITGHGLNDVRSILDAHYLHRDPELARAAIYKLEMGYAKRIAEAKTGT